jgi:3-hydroxyacyl-[acyl-carrier-protein] dehydratase
MTTDLYQIADYAETDNSITCRISYDSSHEIFKGHFPDNPIVPGVCTIAMVKAVLEASLKRKLLLKESAAVKFLGLITPSMSPTLNLSWKEEDDQHLQATAAMTEDGTTLFKMVATYRKEQ